MALFSRSAGGAEAVYARCLDGEHLWLAVRAADAPVPLALRRPDADDVPLETAVEAGLTASRVDLLAALADVPGDVELRLVAGRGRRAAPVTWTPEARRPDSPTLATPPSRDRRWQVELADVEGAVVVRRTALAPVVEVAGVSADDGLVRVHLRGAGAASRAEVVSGRSEALGAVPVADGALVLDDLPPVPAGATATVRVDGRPVVRARNLLTRPHFSVGLPALVDPEVELRWLKDGRLALHRREAAS